MSTSTSFQGRQQHGWDNSSHDYHAHILRIQRMPSVLDDVPRYPSVHRAFNNKVIVEEEPEIQQQHPDKSGKKVHISEQEQIIVDDGNGDYIEENIDMEADGFLKQKQKRFELCKWKTFKMQ